MNTHKQNYWNLSSITDKYPYIDEIHIWTRPQNVLLFLERKRPMQQSLEGIELVFAFFYGDAEMSIVHKMIKQTFKILTTFRACLTIL